MENIKQEGITGDIVGESSKLNNEEHTESQENNPKMTSTETDSNMIGPTSTEIVHPDADQQLQELNDPTMTSTETDSNTVEQNSKEIVHLDAKKELNDTIMTSTETDSNTVEQKLKEIVKPDPEKQLQELNNSTMISTETDSTTVGENSIQIVNPDAEKQLQELNDPIVISTKIDSNTVEQKSTETVHPDAKKQLGELIEKKGIIDYNLDIEPGSAKGENYAGVIAKATIQGKTKSGDSISLNWIIKSAPTSEIMRQATKMIMAYKRESFMYEKVFPYFQNFQREKCAMDPFDSTAPFVMSYLEPPKETLAMQDMKSLGYVMKDRKRPLDYNHAKLVMKEYGKLHAVSYALKDQRPEEFQKLADEARECMCTRSTINFEELIKHNERFNSKVLKSLDPLSHGRACELFKKYASKCVDITLDTMELTHDSPYSVIGHGDSWVNNMLFKYDDTLHPENPTKICLLDWQLARYGSPAFDLTYFIFTCTDKTLRDKYYDKLIKLYYYSLCSHLVDLGSNPDKLITFENLQSELKRYSFIGMQISIVVLYLMLSEKDEVPDLSDAANPEEVMRSFSFESKNESAYLERIGGVVLDFADKGYLDLFIKL